MSDALEEPLEQLAQDLVRNVRDDAGGDARTTAQYLELLSWRLAEMAKDWHWTADHRRERVAS